MVRLHIAIHIAALIKTKNQKFQRYVQFNMATAHHRKQTLGMEVSGLPQGANGQHEMF